MADLTGGDFTKFTVIENGHIDMRLSGEPAKIFMIQLIELFKQNGGKNFLATTFAGLGEKYSIIIQSCNGEDSAAEKLERLTAQNRELTTKLDKIYAIANNELYFKGGKRDCINAFWEIAELIKTDNEDTGEKYIEEAKVEVFE